ncbi:ubiquinone biosynthesis hydrox [Clavulina sp. PMI_390]|nr:ubiquinone biosynthesis hydrox [Clavulina sp. PMI_390]
MAVKIFRNAGQSSRPKLIPAKHRRTFGASSRHFWSSASNASSHSNVDPYDIVIVGGGPAGLSLAAALGSQSTSGDSLKIALVESSDLGRVRNWKEEASRYTNRVSSITNASQQFIKDVGAWKYVDESRTAPIDRMEVWDGVSNARIVFSQADMDADVPQMARLTENLNLQRALLQRLDDMPEQVSLLDKTKVESISQPDSTAWPVVNLSDGSSLQTRLLVGADGPNSPVRKFAGIESYGWSYPTHAVVATLFHHPSPAFMTDIDPYSSLSLKNTVAYQRFLPTGPIAFLPLSPSGDVSSLVWSTTPQLAAFLKTVPPEALAMLVNAAFRLPDISLRYLNARLLQLADEGSVSSEAIEEEIRFRETSDGISETSPLYSSDVATITAGVPPIGSESYPPLVHSVQPGTPASFPLRLSHADSYVTDRIALIGDAAHTVHPLAGQGLNMGLSDAKALSETIVETLALGGDIGGYTNLLPYHQRQYIPNHGILSVTDKLHKLYALQSPLAVWARSTGLEVVNELGPLKGALMSAAGASSVSWKGAGSESEYSQAASPVWDVAARAIEGVNSAAELGKAVSSSFLAAAGNLAQNVARTLEDGSRKV